MKFKIEKKKIPITGKHISLFIVFCLVTGIFFVGVSVAKNYKRQHKRTETSLDQIKNDPIMYDRVVKDVIGLQDFYYSQSETGASYVQYKLNGKRVILAKLPFELDSLSLKKGNLPAVETGFTRLSFENNMVVKYFYPTIKSKINQKQNLVLETDSSTIISENLKDFHYNSNLIFKIKDENLFVVENKDHQKFSFHTENISGTSIWEFRAE